MNEDDTIHYDDTIRYDVWIESALRGVVHRAVSYVVQNGLPDEHHFYITFDTQAPGVVLAGFLRAQHPEEMTIVLQNQYEDLTVDDENMGVTLYFKGRAERVVVPFASISGFADPSVNFGLQLKMVPSDALGDEESDIDLPAIPPAEEQTDEAGDGPSADVIALDTFRKK